MAPDHLLCVGCKAPAVAVVTVEVARGRAHWPVCPRSTCRSSILLDVGLRLQADAEDVGVVVEAEAREVGP